MQNTVKMQNMITCVLIVFQSDMIEEETKQQSKSVIWYQQRAGRITASNFKASIKTSIENPSKSLVTKICDPVSVKFTTQATR